MHPQNNPTLPNFSNVQNPDQDEHLLHACKNLDPSFLIVPSILTPVPSLRVDVGSLGEGVAAVS